MTLSAEHNRAEHLWRAGSRMAHGESAQEPTAQHEQSTVSCSRRAARHARCVPLPRRGSLPTGYSRLLTSFSTSNLEDPLVCPKHAQVDGMQASRRVKLSRSTAQSSPNRLASQPCQFSPSGWRCAGSSRTCARRPSTADTFPCRLGAGSPHGLQRPRPSAPPPPLERSTVAQASGYAPPIDRTRCRRRGRPRELESRI